MFERTLIANFNHFGIAPLKWCDAAQARAHFRHAFAPARRNARCENDGICCDMQDMDREAQRFRLHDDATRHIGNHNTSLFKILAQRDRQAIAQIMRMPREQIGAARFSLVKGACVERVMVFTHGCTCDDAAGKNESLVASEGELGTLKQRVLAGTRGADDQDKASLAGRQIFRRR